MTPLLELWVHSQLITRPEGHLIRSLMRIHAGMKFSHETTKIPGSVNKKKKDSIRPTASAALKELMSRSPVASTHVCLRSIPHVSLPV